ncbi:MAG: phospholipid carrier-dependent glycosyltransferase [Clostridia bacterium]|nr:phospholipid carrier-dependent glycosyltransferase [Clostridia bacterium]
MKKSAIVLVLIILVYSIVSFYNLGSGKSPKSFKTFDRKEISVLRLDNMTNIKKIRFYIGYNINHYKVYLMEEENSKQAFYLNCEFDYSCVFTWKDIEVNSDSKYQYIGIYSEYENNSIGEVVAYDDNDNVIGIDVVDDKDEALVDEQDTVPDEISFMNSVYFDEVYHARTAYEHLNDIEPFECVHPPLGKIIISIPVAIFGSSPLAFRFMGNIAGILMIIVAYFIGKELFKKEWYGVISASIMALDGMHFVQTRIATVDSFLVLFCMTSFLFMIKYIGIEKKGSLKKKLIYLLFSGLFIGMGIATKWTALFVGLGLAIIFFVHFIYNIVKNKSFNKDDWKVIGACVIFFIVIPICIYLASYIPLFNNKGCRVKDLNSLVKYTKDMYEYHSKLEAEHPFTSSWYTWPVLYKPMWYYVNYPATDMVSDIVCLGNPFIWWFGAIATVISLLYTIVKRNKATALLLVMIASTWLPYVFIGRIMFIYHYFITLPFVMLSIVWALKWIEKKLGSKIVSIAVLILFLVGFIYYYPIYSGKTVSKVYIEDSKIMNSWVY